MKRKEIQEVRDLPINELKEKSKNLRIQLYQLRSKLKVGQLKNYSSLSSVRKDIARMETIIKEKVGSKDEEKEKS